MGILARVGRHLPNSVQPSIRKYRYEHLVRHWSPEPDALACKRFIQRGADVLDIGANIGCFTRLFSECVGETGTVHAVEPVRETFGYLLHNVEKLGLKNVFLYNVAASDRCGVGRMVVPQWEGGGRNLYEARIADDGNFSVRLLTLDSMFHDVRPSFVKCDTEGHDIEVLRGARRIITDFQPVWLLEVTHPETVMPFMQEHGYRAMPVEHSVFFLPPGVAW
ncbi:MAG TPA: FkbM family methyltransferase [Candidatus Binatia bacterium]|nr:FkbM family methyltransferase [Candidatus Binatia bacterium]